MQIDGNECVLCGEDKVPEGKTVKARFYCTCGKEWILEKRKANRFSSSFHMGIADTKTRLILDSLSLFNSTLQLSDLVDNFAEFIHQKMNKRNVGILLMDTDRGKINLSSYKSENQKLKRILKKMKLDYDLSYGILIKSMTESRSVFYQLSSETHPFYSYYQNLTGTISQLIVPIVYNNNPLGLITIDYPNEEKDMDFSNPFQEKGTLEVLVSQFAVALRNSFLYDRSKKQSAHFQNLHISALTLSKLYLDNHEEMIRMILLAASSFVETSENYIFEIFPNQESYKRYSLSKDHSTGHIHTKTDKIHDRDRTKIPLIRDGFRESQLAIPFSSEEGIQYILHLIRETDHFTRDDFEVLNAFIALSKITIDNTYLYQKMTEQKKFETEIDIAREIQLGMLPNKIPQFPNFEFSGIMEAARGVGGDYYDFVISPDKKDVVICIGDVSGKGVGAGMVMATVRTILHSLVRKKPTPRELLNDINTYLYYNYNDSTIPRFMTMTIIYWSPETGNFHFGGAGHGTIFIFRKESKKVEVVETKGIVLGIQPKIDSIIHEGSFQLNEGDSILLYTDGVTEAMNPRGEAFEEENLMATFSEFSHLPAVDILQSITRKIKDFTASREQHDDITMVCIKKYPSV